MKFTIKYITPLLGLAMLAMSCSKSYLDLKPYNAVLLTDAIKTEADLQVALAGAYSSLRSANLYGRTLPVRGDLQGDNTYITTANSGRYISMNNYVFTAADGDANGIWTSGYVAIKNANTVINSGLGGTANMTQYIGEAYAIRALMHFELVRNFSQPFTVDPNGAGIPIVTTFDQNVKPTRPTIKDVYTQIIADLEKAYSTMTLYRGSGYMSKYAARALEARVYASMGDWANAKAMATDVIANSGFAMVPAASYVNYWANPASQATTKNETFFEVISESLNNNGFDQIGFIYLTTGGGYGDVLATPELAALYGTADVRKTLCAVGTRAGQSGTVYLCQKYITAPGSADHDDTKVIRLSEVYLILAEANYNLGDFVNANLNLNKVATQRDPSFTGYVSVGAQVLEDILTEKRKELAFEGQRFYDLLRLKRSWTKIKNQNPLLTVSVAPGNAGSLLPIPQAELDANKNMTQNPGY